MNAKQRRAQHERRRRHQAATRSPSGQGQVAGRPPGAQALQRGKTAPAKRRLRTVHDMADTARFGRDDAERAWRRAFKGIHAIGYKAGGAPSSAGGLQKMTPVPTSHGPEHRSGAQKRKQRGRRRVLPRHPLSATLGDIQGGVLMSQVISTPDFLRRCGWMELRPGLWTRDLARMVDYVLAQAKQPDAGQVRDA